MKKVILISLCIIGFSLQSFSQKYIARNGHVWFYSEAPMENIEAHNYQTTSILDKTNGDLAFSLMISGYEFEKALMQEHFNEKYMHSEKFPKSTFKGKIVNINEVDLSSEGKHNVKIKGDLTVHGVTKEVETDGVLEVKGDQIIGKAKFPVTVADYDIEIPSLVKDNIAKVVDVNVDITYDEYNKD